MTTAPRILMCPPDYYGVHYEINPWMNRERKVEHAEAVRQWNGLVDLLTELGAAVPQMDPVDGFPDLVFTANAALIHRDLAILSRFRYPQRQGEEPLDRAWLEADGFRVEPAPEEVHFEGAGDALFCGDTLFAGYRFRSDAGGHQQIGGMLDCRVIPLELTDPYYYHLDTCFCPLRPGVAIYHPPAVDRYAQQVLDELVDVLIPVEAEEAEQFACNAVVVGETVVTNTGCPQLHRDLKDRGWTPIETPLGEFVKAGGSAKCLTLRLDGEEAAGWRGA